MGAIASKSIHENNSQLGAAAASTSAVPVVPNIRFPFEDVCSGFECESQLKKLSSIFELKLNADTKDKNKRTYWSDIQVEGAEVDSKRSKVAASSGLVQVCIVCCFQIIVLCTFTTYIYDSDICNGEAGRLVPVIFTGYRICSRFN
jgi:hypothetical protein